MSDVANARDRKNTEEAPANITERKIGSGETAGASLANIDFTNRPTYYLRTWDNRAWTAPGPEDDADLKADLAREDAR